ncbi:tRNA uridine-5-carboxymethylaminomethyl(34) synthesis GTPase MnmE [Sagittula salina]|uniref:tRNA modification GTPase MnmE n=1 Tax=Sagittula salina TaxID=2820268 RepID=A0A940MP55_9RHOB|nr:tRNA uridine-5-carboxymethylaminomethyl(34) synthesis GTPase MnmE [Sagittula salina]MBP0483315.1 tRNA uridine-5-carboxymethylaminomethyl(34) synthesis GTPase MnmE [Sagittula salina]
MDTIFALASAPGKAGVAVLRVSGPHAWRAAETLAGRVPAPRYASLCTLKDSQGAFLDQAIVLCFEAGKSFTGEESVEFHLHGSVAVVKAVLGALGKLDGFRLAGAGEFTRRALENGCLDLTQVEALSDLIESETEAQRQHALKVLEGALSKKVESWRQDLIRAAALIEATIDFVDEDVPVDVSGEVCALLDRVEQDVVHELQGLDAAERVRSGFEVAIVGPPNAGKSTLLNALAGREAAITSNVAGTTRDIIEVRMDIGGIPVTFLDTAGLRETDDPVEQLGVDRARQRARAADLRIQLLEPGSDPLMNIGDCDLVLRPKSDNGGLGGISGKTGAGIPELFSRIAATFSDQVANAGLASHERHRVNLIGSLENIRRARLAMDKGFENQDLVSEDIRISFRYLETLVGKVDVEHLLDEIFSSFCIGK